MKTINELKDIALLKADDVEALASVLEERIAINESLVKDILSVINECEDSKAELLIEYLSDDDYSTADIAKIANTRFDAEFAEKLMYAIRKGMNTRDVFDESNKVSMNELEDALYTLPELKEGELYLADTQHTIDRLTLLDGYDTGLKCDSKKRLVFDVEHLVDMAIREAESKKGKIVNSKIVVYIVNEDTSKEIEVFNGMLISLV